MKNRNRMLVMLLCISLLSGCGGAAEPDTGEPAADGTAVQTLEKPPVDTAPSLAEDEEPPVIICRIVDGAEDGNLLLAKLCRCAGPDVFRLSAGGLPVTLDGEPADAAALEDGMPIEIAYSGNVLETFPAQLGEVYSISAWSRGQKENPGGTAYDLCGLYLQVLDDLWEKDSGLNDSIAVAGLDLSMAPGELLESEKAAIAWRFGETHNVEVVTGTFEELKEQGYFTPHAESSVNWKESAGNPTLYEWEDGCLFSISVNQSHDAGVCSLPVIFFDAEKWRSPLGAYCLYGCSATWAEMGAWNGYSVDSEMIA